MITKPAKSHISFFALLLLLTLTACPFDKEDEKPKDEPKLTDEFLWYKDGDPLRIKVWYGTSVDITYFRADGTVERTEELVNYRAWNVLFGESGPHSDETNYLWTDAERVLDEFMPAFGRYELNSSTSQITFGHFKKPLFTQEVSYGDITFDVSFKADFYLSDWLKFTNVRTAPDGSKIEISFTLSA